MKFKIYYGMRSFSDVVYFLLTFDEVIIFSANSANL